MRPLIAVGIALSMAFLAVAAEKKVKSAKAIEPKAASELAAKKKAVIIDVREKEEREEIVPGSAWFPNSQVGDQKAWSAFVSDLPKDKTVIFHCRSGRRSKAAAEKLAKQGYKTAYFEGPEQWKAAGLPLEKPPR